MAGSATALPVLGRYAIVYTKSHPQKGCDDDNPIWTRV